MARRLLFFALLWTLVLLFIGSVVHATGASLACPDWPTCYGTMMPEMTGGIFWEHLHRLWAGALVLLFAGAVVVVRRTMPERTDLFALGLFGIALLLVQSALGAITVLYLLPDAISTSHLALAFTFLALLTVMTVRARPDWESATDEEPPADDGGLARRAGLWVALLTFAQSVVGALVRHTDSGVACPDVPLCLGRIIPPLDYPSLQLHFGHRVLGIVVAIVTLRYAWLVARSRVSGEKARRLAIGLGAVVISQVIVGFLSVAYQLAAPLVSTHTLLAAVLITLSVALAAGVPDADEAPVSPPRS